MQMVGNEQADRPTGTGLENIGFVRPGCGDQLLKH